MLYRPKALLAVGLLLSACGHQPPAPALAPPSALPPGPAAPRAAESPPPPATASGGYKGLGVESVAPEVLAKFAPKPLPQEESRRIQAMLDVRAPGAGMVSLDGKRLFFTWTITGSQQVFRLDAPMGFPAQLTGGEDSTSIVGLSPDGKTLLLSRDRSGEENPGLYRMSVEGGPLVVIQHKKKVQTFLDHMSDDGRTIYFRANDITPESYAIYRFDLVTGQRDLVFSEPGIWSVADARVDAGGKDTKLLLAESVGSNMKAYFELDLASKKLDPLFGQGEREDYVAHYGAGDEVLVLTSKLSEYRRAYAWTKSKGFEVITPELKFDVWELSVDRRKTRVVYEVNEGGYLRLGALDAKTRKPLALPALPNADHHKLGATSFDGRNMSFIVDPGNRPSESYVYDFRQKKLTMWHKPAAPEVDLASFARVSLSSYPSRDGTQVPMFVRRPKACESRTPEEGPCPVVVNFHGGPEAQTLAGFSTSAQLFVDAGFVYVQPNVRGSDGYGKTYLHADDGPKRKLAILDIEDASRFIREKWSVGGKAPKIGIYGGSYGGYSTLVGMTIFAGAFDCGVSVVGISSLLSFLENTAPYRRILRISEYGDPEKDREALLELSPTSHIDKLNAPLMLLQGATDPRVPVGEALQFHEALERKGISSELMIFADEGHGFRKRSNQVLAMGHTLRFFEEHLKK